jgi:uncharacterized protein YwqG
MTYEKLEPLTRTPYFAVCADADGAFTDSKFSGLPWLSRSEDWPKCKNCDKEMQLLLQLNLNDLPSQAKIKGNGLLQLFYCTNQEPNCEVDCGSWFWNEKAMLVRVVDAFGEARALKETPVINAFPPKVIRRWEPGTPELPRVEELIGYMELSDEEQEELFDAEDSEAYPGPEGGDKLGGWPYWIQGVEYPECRECNKPMKYVFQIDSEVNVPFMWGDSGCGHISQCEEHPEILAFGWACN